MKAIIYKLIHCTVILVVFGMQVSCKKFLDETPNKEQVIITKASDLQALLDDQLMSRSYYSLATAGADEYYYTQSLWENSGINQRNTYLWAPQTDIDAWSGSYMVVFQANVVLSSLEKVTGGDREKEYIKGQALFKRAFTFYEIAQLYSPVFSDETKSAPGIVLNLEAKVEGTSQRATVEQTYSRITEDLKTAIDLLPVDKTAPNRPNKASCYGMLARVYLAMSDYPNAKTYARLYLQHNPELTDFNTLDTTANPGFSFNEPEISYYAYSDGDLPGNMGIVDSLLYQAYDENDLRRPVYFYDPGDGNYTFKGSHSGISAYAGFCGIVTDEIYLIRAECEARGGNVNLAMEDLNRLLKTRWKTGTYEDLTAVNKESALDIILAERKKELVYRGTRWTDIRRLNLEGRNITLKRFINDRFYELPANDKRFVWLLPSQAILLGKYEQNPR